jgi:hypothetical protein
MNCQCTKQPLGVAPEDVLDFRPAQAALLARLLERPDRLAADQRGGDDIVLRVPREEVDILRRQPPGVISASRSGSHPASHNVIRTFSKTFSDGALT